MIVLKISKFRSLVCSPIKAKKYVQEYLEYNHYYRFGPGAGAASGGLLAVMPRSRSMVRRVAAISGSPLAGNQTHLNPTLNTRFRRFY